MNPIVQVIDSYQRPFTLYGALAVRDGKLYYADERGKYWPVNLTVFEVRQYAKRRGATQETITTQQFAAQDAAPSKEKHWDIKPRTRSNGSRRLYNQAVANSAVKTCTNRQAAALLTAFNQKAKVRQS